MLEMSRRPLDSRTELVQVTRMKDSVLMRTVELWQRCIPLRWRQGCSLPKCFRQSSGLAVLYVRANLHMCTVKLLPVWGPRLCDESRFLEHVHGGGNHQHVDHATTSSCSIVLKARCRVLPLSRLGQTRCRGPNVRQLILTVSRRS